METGDETKTASNVFGSKRPAMPLNSAPSDRKTKTKSNCSFVALLFSVEWIEDMFYLVGSNASAKVTNRHGGVLLDRGSSAPRCESPPENG